MSLRKANDAEARRAADEFCFLYDRLGDAPLFDVLASFRERYRYWDEAARFEFLVLVAGHVAARLTRQYPDGVPRAGRLMAEWFLR